MNQQRATRRFRMMAEFGALFDEVARILRDRRSQVLGRTVKSLQIGVVIFGLFDLVLTAGYYLRLPWATATWPWPVSSLDFLLVSSFLAGATVVLLWLGFVGDFGAAVGATMNVGLMSLGASIFLLQIYHREHDPRALVRAIVFGAFAAVNVGALAWSARRPIRDRRPADLLLRLSFGLLSGLLAFASVQLFRRSPTIFPWSLEPDVSTMFGWLFAGSAVYFTYGFLRPTWHNMRGQLLAILACDLVLLVPCAYLFRYALPEHLPILRAYVAVLVYSTLLSVYYVFINRRTRVWRIQTGDHQSRPGA